LISVIPDPDGGPAANCAAVQPVKTDVSYSSHCLVQLPPRLRAVEALAYCSDLRWNDPPEHSRNIQR